VIRAGIQYFVMVFTAGFVLGTARAMAVAPRIGEFGAVLVELPIMLALSWWICGWLVRRHKVPARWTARATMGGTAFVLLLIAEWTLALGPFGRTAADQWSHYATAAGFLGLAGQVLFAAFPLLQLNRKRRDD
jgi:hypothetical protein